MEVRFIKFDELPKLYCYLAGKAYNEILIAPFLRLAEDIKDVVVNLPEDSLKTGEKILLQAKNLANPIITTLP